MLQGIVVPADAVVGMADRFCGQHLTLSLAELVLTFWNMDGSSAEELQRLVLMPKLSQYHRLLVGRTTTLQAAEAVVSQAQHRLVCAAVVVLFLS